jgi:hypothetical protein
MFDPDADITKVPWQILIRARFAHEVDAVIASNILSEVARHGSHELARTVAEAAFEAVSGRHAPTELTDSARMMALSAVADWDGEICPPGWPYHGPRPHFLDEIGDPIVMLVLEQAVILVKAAGSPQLQKTLLPALQSSGLREPVLNRG